MKKLISIYNLLFLTLTSVCALADASSNLHERLDKVNSFYAKFNQKINDSNGLKIQEGEGELWVKQPNQFYWHMITPNDGIIVSNGKILWIYNPFIEQVTITWMSNITSNMPFMLVASEKQHRDWRQYNIKQHGDTFILTPKTHSNITLKHITINIADNGIINQLSFVDLNGQRSSYIFKKYSNKPISTDKFIFTPPQGVTIDDQRQ